MEDTINLVFIKEEANYILDNRIKGFVLECIDLFPEYFFKVPASRKKYHYPDERKSGGLVLHVRRLCKLVRETYNEYELNTFERDILIASAILHDSFHRGVPPNVKNASDEFHPLYVPKQFVFNGFADQWLDRKTYDEIMTCVVSHNGIHSIFPPIMNVQKKLPSIFKMLDYISTRDFIKIEL